MSTALNAIAWREILARVLAKFDRYENVSPDWLINPATRRRLKLDHLYPEIGLAVRFVGLTAKGQPRRSDWELLEEEQRDQTRAELCRINGVELFLLNPNHADPAQQLRQLRMILSRLSRQLAQGRRPDGDKLSLMPRLAEARSQLDQVVRRVKQPDDLALYAELWRDREMAAAGRPAPVTPSAAAAPSPSYEVGQPVRHALFGPGSVLSISGAGNEAQIIVQFESGQTRTFLASLVADKLFAG